MQSKMEKQKQRIQKRRLLVKASEEGMMKAVPPV